MHIDSRLDDTGAAFFAEAGLSGKIFGTDFDIASAGVQAVATSSGLMSLTAWLGVFLLDPRSMRQVPYYVIAIQYQAAVCFPDRAGFELLTCTYLTNLDCVSSLKGRCLSIDTTAVISQVNPGDQNVHLSYILVSFSP